jgi:site-specific recombinase XerD
MNSTTTIVCSYCLHKNVNGILLQFPINLQLNKIISSLGVAKYSYTKKGWIIPTNKSYLNKLILLTKNIAEVNINSLKAVPAKPPLTSTSLAHIIPKNKIHYENLKQHLVNSGYSPSTIKTYTGEFAVFLQTIGKTDASLLTPQRLCKYFYYCHIQLKLTENTLHSRINALKYFYEKVLGYDKFFYEIPRPKKKLALPKVISEEKIIDYIINLKNLKHKAILLLSYSAGLRVSEVINLQVTDIDSQRMQIAINGAKGKKDRRVPLSKTILEILREYYKTYKPKFWLFEGQQKGEKYCTRSAQLIFKQTYKQANLPPSVSFHSLRHSYATHLLDNGTDIKYIQDLLGHNSIKTTLKYIHVTNKDLIKIESPLDKILRKHGA